MDWWAHSAGIPGMFLPYWHERLLAARQQAAVAAFAHAVLLTPAPPAVVALLPSLPLQELVTPSFASVMTKMGNILLRVAAVAAVVIMDFFFP